MRKLNVSTLVTLDGVIQDPGGFQELEEGGWGNRYFDEEAQRYALEQLRESDAFLCGRVTYEVFKELCCAGPPPGSRSTKITQMPTPP
jgi:hypothetical protein